MMALPGIYMPQSLSGAQILTENKMQHRRIQCVVTIVRLPEFRK